jgi:multidrug transporter EmrE-like cation transporter|tara:strand:+ start:2799 stop:3641 length:843 start_codon:yes stop_codon:yes gene_type:complete
MNTIVFFTVLFSAILHAIWNSMASKYKDKNVSIGAIVYGHVPLCLVAVIFLPAPSVESIPYIILSAVIHQGYQNFLLTAYQTGKFTTVYPVARGFGPLVATVISIIFLGVYLKTFTIISILLISTGVMLIGLFSKSVIKNNKILYTSLATGVFIGIYSVVDGQGARISGSAISYMSWVFILSALFFPIVLHFRRQKNILKKTLKDGKKVFWIGGTFSYLAYVITVWAFTKAPIPMVSALRESSIIIAIFIGYFYLKDKINFYKVVSILLIFFGVIGLKFF